MVLRLDFGCSGKPVPQAGLSAFATAEVRESLGRHPGAVVVAQHAYKLSGYEAYVVQSTVDESTKAAHGTLYAASVCLLPGAQAACWQALNYDPKSSASWRV